MSPERHRTATGKSKTRPPAQLRRACVLAKTSRGWNAPVTERWSGLRDEELVDASPVEAAIEGAGCGPQFGTARASHPASPRSFGSRPIHFVPRVGAALFVRRTAVRCFANAGRTGKDLLAQDENGRGFGCASGDLDDEAECSQDSHENVGERCGDGDGENPRPKDTFNDGPAYRIETFSSAHPHDCS
jgi:hypothetical protein